MPLESHLSHFNVKLDGQQAAKATMDDLLEATIENSLNLPDVCTLRLHDARFHWLDSEMFAEGRKVEVFAGEGQHQLLRVFCGEVVALEMDLAAHGVPTLSVRCYDRSHRLHRGRLSRSFINMKDSDIVTQVGQEVGLSVQAEATDVVHDWVLQNNQSNWEFLQERAARNGFRLYVQGDKDLHFQKVKEGDAGIVELDWGKTLRSFRPRVSASTQVDEVEVRGWDPSSKQAIVGRSARPNGTPQVGDSRDGGEIAHAAFGPAKMMVVDRPIHSHTEAEDLARSICDDIGGAFLEADGLCYGVPQLKPGMQVSIKNIGKRFSGKYYVTSTTHTYTPAEGYATIFGVNGKRSSSLVSLLEGDELSNRAALGGGIVVGVVTANRDPEGMGRVKVMYPWLTEDHTSWWARTASQMAGSGRGMFNLPEIGDEVLVAFEHGDVSRPYVIGQLWNGKDALPGLQGNPTLGGGGEVNRRGFHSRIGHQLNFDDTGGKGNVTIKTANGHVITADDANKMVQITTTGGHTIVLDDQGQAATIRTTSGHTVNMNDASSAITVQDNAGDKMTMAQGNISINALQMLNLVAPLTNIAGALSVSITSRLITEVAGILNTHAAGIKTGISGGELTNVLGGLMVNIDAAQIKLNCADPKTKDSDEDKNDEDSDSSDSSDDGGSGDDSNDGSSDSSDDSGAGDDSAGGDGASDGDGVTNGNDDGQGKNSGEKTGEKAQDGASDATLKGRVEKGVGGGAVEEGTKEGDKREAENPVKQAKENVEALDKINKIPTAARMMEAGGKASQYGDKVGEAVSKALERADAVDRASPILNAASAGLDIGQSLGDNIPKYESGEISGANLAGRTAYAGVKAGASIVAGDAGGAVGAEGGAIAGAAIGEAIFPLGGGIPGAAVGAVVGYFGGSYAGVKGVDAADKLVGGEEAAGGWADSLKSKADSLKKSIFGE